MIRPWNMAERIGDIRERIEKAAGRAGRKPGEIRLMGVSKFHGAEEVEEAIRAGLSLFGESRVREAAEKFPGINARHRVELHLIGALQRNKARQALEVCDGIQSVDRDELVRTLGALSAEREKPLEVFLELRTGEETKSGYEGEDELFRAAELVLSFPALKLSGLMTMAPLTAEEGPVRKSFRTLRRAGEQLARRFPGGDFSALSMGMSGDFEIAVEEGSTLVRIGQAIFGEASAP
ncbi:MAG: YggS family pyridoxal phosphate-dependent enzyme [Treponema sp.]|jgi:pyridoxal phosphate enzyme (YggS family)|nr:YggS family pyridoxal phosphate-dependent enzyme [Treponema sp.]